LISGLAVRGPILEARPPALNDTAVRVVDRGQSWPDSRVFRREVSAVESIQGGGTTPSVSDDPLDVLLIEDDPDIAELYRTKLESDGYRVAHAADGRAGLEMANAAPPDLIFLDLRLPDVDGIQVLRDLRADPRTEPVPVVILTNYGDPELRDAGLELGIREFMIKSEVSPQKVSASAQRWSNREAEREV
jgi:CheY-like chemotaxis protein